MYVNLKNFCDCSNLVEQKDFQVQDFLASQYFQLFVKLKNFFLNKIKKKPLKNILKTIY